MKRDAEARGEAVGRAEEVEGSGEQFAVLRAGGQIAVAVLVATMPSSTIESYLKSETGELLNERAYCEKVLSQTMRHISR